MKFRIDIIFLPPNNVISSCSSLIHSEPFIKRLLPLFNLCIWYIISALVKCPLWNLRKSCPLVCGSNADVIINRFFLFVLLLLKAHHYYKNGWAILFFLWHALFSKSSKQGGKVEFSCPTISTLIVSVLALPEISLWY